MPTGRAEKRVLWGGCLWRDWPASSSRLGRVALPFGVAPECHFVGQLAFPQIRLYRIGEIACVYGHLSLPWRSQPRSLPLKVDRLRRATGVGEGATATRLLGTATTMATHLAHMGTMAAPLSPTATTVAHRATTADMGTRPLVASGPPRRGAQGVERGTERCIS